MFSTRYAKFAWAVMVWNVLTALWGAFVRATGSGAGCGNHWPLCNGDVLPRTPQADTLVEFSHRITSGIALIGVLVLLVWAFRAFPKGHPVRWGAVGSAFFIITESLLGASLVIFGWVTNNDSAGRAVVVSIHLVNTFLLIASLAVTAWWASGQRPVVLPRYRWVIWGMRVGLLGLLVVGITGAITALGDTLFPAASLAEGLRQDMDPSRHFLIELRVWHPVISVLVGVYVAWLARLVSSINVSQQITRVARVLIVLVGIQLLMGFVNVLLLAPVWMQVVHLLLADGVWLSAVFLAASIAAVPVPRFEVSEKQG
ncbi:MAG: COX15/CtaA family protein [Caldilineales bacterium]